MSNLTGSTIKNLGLKTIRETEVLIPETNEQKEIGDFFKQIDKLITLYQQELNKLRNIKKASLQKMFV